MTTSSQLMYPFDIQQFHVKINDLLYNYLAGPEVGGINRIVPMPTGDESPLMNADGAPIGRIKPKSLAGRVAMVIISVFPNSVDATNLMALAKAPQKKTGDPMNGVTVEVYSDDYTAKSGTSGATITSMTVNHVVFAASPYNFDAGRKALVFQGIGWNLAYSTQEVKEA